MNAATLLLSTLVVLGGPQDEVARNNAPGQLMIDDCLIDIVDERDVPALDAGRLQTVEYREGDIVDLGDLLATIDQREAEARRKQAMHDRDAAKEKATNDVNKKFAEASERVALYEYKVSEAANKKHRGTISLVEMTKFWFQHERAIYQIDQAEHEMVVSKIEALAAEARLHEAELVLERRQIVAPISGVVVELYHKDGDWVEPGEPVLHLVFLERLRVKGTVDAKQYSPSELDNKPVSVDVELSRGRKETFEGKIVFVDPQIDQRGHFNVWAEVSNRVEGGHWVLQPGREGSMTINLGPGSDNEVGQFSEADTTVR